MKNISVFILFIFINIIAFTESISQIELDFLRNQEQIIKANNFIPKETAKNLVLEEIPTYFPKMKKVELNQILTGNCTEVFLAEEITPAELRGVSTTQFYYIVQVKFIDGRIMVLRSIDAKTGEFCDGEVEDDKDKNKFMAGLSRQEVLAYIGKYFSFQEQAKITMEAIFDYSFTKNITLPNRAADWKYRITIKDGLFTSSVYPAGMDTLFVSPFIDGNKGVREEPAPDNCPAYKLIPHRIFAFRSAVQSQKSAPATESKAISTSEQSEVYIGVD